MPNAHTPHSRKLRQDTAAAWIKSEVARGGCRLSLVLPPDAKEQLGRLVTRYGTKTAAICAALALADAKGIRSTEIPWPASLPARTNRTTASKLA